MAAWQLHENVLLLIDGRLAASGVVVSSPFRQFSDDGVQSEMFLVQISAMEADFESTVLVRFNGWRLSDCIDMQVPWPDVDMVRAAGGDADSDAASNEFTRCLNAVIDADATDGTERSRGNEIGGDSVNGTSEIDSPSHGESSPSAANEVDTNMDDGLRRFPPRMLWRGKMCLLEGQGGREVCAGRIQASLPEETFLDAALGHDEVGVLVLREPHGGTGELMSHQRWPLASVRLEGGEMLDAIAAFHRDQPLEDAEGRLRRGVPKAAYTSLTRARRDDACGPPKRLRLSTEEEARQLSREECCPWSCCERFPWETTILVHSQFWRKSFEDRREFGVDLAGRFRPIDGEASPVMTLEGVDVCETAC
jgi:hypothetical protein